MDSKLKEIIADILKVEQDKISDSLSMKDTNIWDSLKHMELVVTIEQTFGLELTFEEIVKMKSVKEIKRVLGERGVDGFKR